MAALDRYDIIKSLGFGGCGEVFFAADKHSPSNRKCIIKKLRKNIPSYQIIKEKFEAEAWILETLEHNQIPKFIERFSHEGDDYLVQEWIDGTDLSKKIKAEGGLDPEKVKQLMQQLLPVIGLLHERGLIHRDIKPSNIMIRRSDELPVLIDYGAAKIIESTAVDEFGTSNTETVAVGSSGFTPTEQLLGQPVPNSDLFALARTAIYCLAGKEPKDYFYQPDVWENELKDVPNTQPTLIYILRKANEDDYRSRFANARSMLDALDAIDFCRKGIEYFNAGQFDPAIAEYTKAIELLPGYYAAYLNRGRSYLDAGQPDLAMRDFSDAVNSNLVKDLSEAYFFRGRVFRERNECEASVAEYSKAIESNPDLISAYLNRGNLFFDKEDFDQALADYSYAIDNNDDARRYKIEDRFLADAYCKRAQIFEKKENFDQCIEDYTKAVELDPQETDAYFRRGLIHHKQKNYGLAVKDYSRLIELEPNNKTYYFNRLIFYRDMGDMSDAVLDARALLSLSASDPESKYYTYAAEFLAQQHTTNESVQDSPDAFGEFACMLVVVVSLLPPTIYPAWLLFSNLSVHFPIGGILASLIVCVVPIFFYVRSFRDYFDGSNHWRGLLPLICLNTGVFLLGNAARFLLVEAALTDSTGDVIKGLVAASALLLWGVLGFMVGRLIMPPR